MTAAGRCFEEFEVGQRFETGVREIGEDAVLAFADVTGDRNPLHLDEGYARTSVFGERVAHGLLGTCIGAGLLQQSGLTRGTLVALLGLSWSFVAPIRFGTAVRLRLHVASTRRTSKPDRGVVVLAAELVSGDDDVLQRGEFTLLVRRREVDEADGSLRH